MCGDSTEAPADDDGEGDDDGEAEGGETGTSTGDVDDGVSDEIADRVEGAGGTVSDTLLRISLLWDDCNDFDLYVKEPVSE